MPEYDNRMRGVIFKNKNRKSDSHPEYTGSYTDDDKNDYWVSAWLNTSKAGEKYFSFSMKRKDEAHVESRKLQNAPEKAPDFDDDIPF